MPNGMTRALHELISTVEKVTQQSLRDLGTKFDIPHQTISYWKNAAKKMHKFLVFILKLRKELKMPWSKYGPLLDKLFLEKEKEK